MRKLAFVSIIMLLLYNLIKKVAKNHNLIIIVNKFYEKSFDKRKLRRKLIEIVREKLENLFKNSNCLRKKKPI